MSAPGPSRLGHERQSPDRLPYPHNDRPNGYTQLTAAGLQNRPDWPTFTFVDIYASQLPQDTTTVDVYRNFRKHGQINMIEVQLNRDGNPTGSATIRFKPPPKMAFWDIEPFPIFRRSRNNFRIRLRLDFKQRIHFTVKSPTRCDVVYDEETIIDAETINFGILLAPTTMMIMDTKTSSSAPDGKVKLVLNLKSNRRELEVHFPHILFSSNSTQGVMRAYRFAVALDQSFSIHQTTETDGEISFILNLNSPPPFKRRLQEAVTASHSASAMKWYEDDAWNRQTDIVRHKQTFDSIDKTPLTVQKTLNSIHIGRWNTFRITVRQQGGLSNACHIFREALQDYNVTVQDMKEFELHHPTEPPLPLLWSMIDDEDTKMSQHSRQSGGWLSETLNRGSLSFPVRYQLEVCVSHGWLSEYNIDMRFLEKLSTMQEEKAKRFLVRVASRAVRFFNPMDIFDDLEFKRPIRRLRIPESCMEMYHATVTATNLLFNTPSVEMTNRVVRQYKQHADRFLRVRFEDDEWRGNSKIFASDNNRMELIFRRVKRVLRHGIKLAGRHYKFLAWGNSQLRERGVYFFAGGPGIPTAGNIRAVMGEFDHETVVAKRAARIGQCFSTTKAIQLRLPRVTRDNLIPDIIRGKYNFTDGVGQISLVAATVAAHQLGIDGDVPSVIQYRLGGCKGVLALSPGLRTSGIKIRESQFKFKSESGDLEVIRCSEFWHAYLNRQLVLVLSGLGVPDAVFLEKQRLEIELLKRAIENKEDAINALRDRVDPNRMTLVVSDMVAAGFLEQRDPFLLSILRLWRAWCLKYLKEKAKLHIQKGAFVLGCVDETATLRGHFESDRPPPDASREERLAKLPEIFLQITDPHTGKIRVIQETCIIARNPSLHPGDIRVVKAIDVKALHHLRDVLVMPQTGDRDLSSMCSGGDLDGDDYIVVWDEQLIPAIINAEPFHYDPPEPKRAQGEITEEDFIAFFHDYMKNDVLGRIGHAHLAWADFLNAGINSDQCLELVHLHSIAVDYNKTGVPASMTRKLSPSSWPHFMERKGKTHRSIKTLGQLYDQVERVNFKPAYSANFDQRILDAQAPSPAMMSQAKKLKLEYDRSMQRIMAQHDIKTEFEIWTTFVLNHSKSASDYKFHEEIGQLSKALKDQYHAAIVKIVGSRDHDHLAPFAIAAYKVTQDEVSIALSETDTDEELAVQQNMPLISFPWILHEVLNRIVSVAGPEDDGTSAVTEIGNTHSSAEIGDASTVTEAGNTQTAAEIDPTLAIKGIEDGHEADHGIGHPGTLSNESPLSIRSSNLPLQMQNLRMSPPRHADSDGIYHSPFRRRSIQSVSSGGSGSGSRTHVQSSTISSAASPVSFKEQAEDDDECQVVADPASDPDLMARFAAEQEDDW